MAGDKQTLLDMGFDAARVECMGHLPNLCSTDFEPPNYMKGLSKPRETVACNPHSITLSEMRENLFQI